MHRSHHFLTRHERSIARPVAGIVLAGGLALSAASTAFAADPSASVDASVAASVGASVAASTAVSASPSGSELAASGSPGATPPATDTVGTPTPSSDGLPLILLGIAALAGGATAVTLRNRRLER